MARGKKRVLRDPANISFVACRTNRLDLDEKNHPMITHRCMQIFFFFLFPLLVRREENSRILARSFLHTRVFINFSLLKFCKDQVFLEGSIIFRFAPPLPVLLSRWTKISTCVSVLNNLNHNSEYDPASWNSGTERL